MVGRRQRLKDVLQFELGSALYRPNPGLTLDAPCSAVNLATKGSLTICVAVVYYE